MAIISYVSGAEPPVNDGERRVIKYLEEHLPDDYDLFPGVQIVRGDRTDDIDVLILTPWALVVGEIKDIAGDFVIDNGSCYVNDELRPQPFNVTNAKARRLKSRLQDADPRLRGVWVAPLVILARQPASLRLNPPILNEGVMTTDRTVEKLTTPSQLLPNPPYRELGELRDGIVRVLNLARGRERNVRFGAYECAELLDRTDDEDLWRAQHRITGHEVEIRHIGRNPARRETRVREAEGEVAAIDRISDAPWIIGPAGMLPQDDGSIALVYPPRQGSTLAELVEAGEDIPAERIILDVASALEAAHAAGVAHGRLSPRWIEVLPDVVEVRGFSLARGEGVPAATRLLAEDEQFMAPEMLRRETAGAPADIYALGKLIALLRPDDEMMLDLAHRLSSDDVAARQVPAGYIREALAGAFGVPTETVGGRSAVAATPPVPIAPEQVEYDEGSLKPGSVVGTHVVTGHLGSGAFSNVYLANHALGGIPRTVKVFKGNDAEELVAHEFRVLQDIDDPNVVRVHDAGHSEAGWYMVSEYLDGETLAQRIDSFDGTSRVGEACLVGHELLNALSTIHSREIYHRDVKPENAILVEGRGTVLFDFGVAATRRSQIDGLTPPYWPPGVPAGANEPDPDLFAVGVVLCELLTGEHPYPDENPHAGERPDTSKLPPGVSAVLKRAIDPDPAVRFATAEEFRAELEPYVDLARPIEVSRRSVYRRVEQLISEGRLDEAENLCLPQWKRLQARIDRKRDGENTGAEVMAGLRVRFAGEKRERIYSLDGSQVQATTRTYQVTGKPGLMIDVRVAEDDDGEMQIATVDAYDSADRFGELVNRLRRGIYREEPGLTIQLTYLKRPAEGRLGKRQPSSLSELDNDAGGDVRQTLLNAGAIAVGRRIDIGLAGPSDRNRNSMTVLMPETKRDEIALLAYLLTSVVPLARELDLLVQDPA